MLSHAAAAAHWGIRRAGAGSIDVTLSQPTGRKTRRGVRADRVTSLPEGERTVHEGIPVTTLARTLLDLAANQLAKTRSWAQVLGHGRDR